jgi:hypothetical protein
MLAASGAGEKSLGSSAAVGQIESVATASMAAMTAGSRRSEAPEQRL